MGIQGLIPFLDKVSSRINISEYKGCCVAVDAYCWLHKGAYTCAEKLAKGEKCFAYVLYCMKYVHMLLSYNIKPILVFDGRHLPAKAGTEKKRRESRDMNRKTAAELLKAGRTEEARNYLRRCVDVTHAMALALMQECRKINVDCIVAPYEADAQLAYLNLQNIAHIVITEDSDLVLFGCSKIVFKLDLQGNGLLVERDRLHLSMGVRAENFSLDSFRYMCILSGCDYLPSLPGIGLSKALKFINKTRDPDIHRALRRLPAYLNMTQLRVSDEYRDSFVHADAMFRYQPVFDPCTRSLVPLTEPPEGEEPPTVVKEQLLPKVAFDLALGNLDPFTLVQVDNFDPDHHQQRVVASAATTMHSSIWSHDFIEPQPSAADKPSFVGTLNCSAVLDVTPLRTAKSLEASEHAAKEDSILPSQGDLLSMYGAGQHATPEPEASRTSVRQQQVPKSPELIAESGAVESCAKQQQSFSPVVSRSKTRNPFAKPKQGQFTGLGPPGAIGHPNYFSALRKFDGVYPLEVDSLVLVVSRYFRSCRAAEGELSAKPEKGAENILKDVLNTNADSAAEDVLSDELMLSGYMSEKENSQEKSVGQPASSSAATNAVQDDTLSFPSSDSCNVASVGQSGSVSSAELGSEEVVMEMEKEETTVSSVKSPLPSFDWSVFACRKSSSTPKLSSSQAVSRTFKNPFRKKVVSNYSLSLGGDVKEFCGAGDAKSLLQHMREEGDLPTKEDAAANCSSGRFSSESFLNAAYQASEDSFKHSQEEPELSLVVSGTGEETFARKLDEVGQPLEDTQWERLSSGSGDSGFQGSQEQMFKAAGPCKPAHRRGTPTLRRLGLGRSSSPSTAPQKQNLLAQYGFSKRRKLEH